MSNLIKINFKDNDRSVLTPRQRLLSKPQVIDLRDANLEAIAKHRRKLMDQSHEARQLFEALWSQLLDSLTWKQFNKFYNVPTVNYRSLCIEVLNSNVAQHKRNLARKAWDAFDLSESLRFDVKQVTETLESKNYWKRGKTA